MSRDFTKIKAWHYADDLCVAIYKLTHQFPRDELYGLTSQLRRAALSVPANIAEGAGRQTKRDYLRFLYSANGSLAEVRYHLHLSQRLDFHSNDQYQQINDSQVEATSTLRGSIKAVESETGVVSRLLALVTSSISLYAASNITGAI